MTKFKAFIFGFIQLFATQTTLLNTTGNDLSPEMKTFYDMRLIDYAQAALVHDQFGQKRPIPKNGGKTIEFRSFSPLSKALTALTEGVTPDGNKLNVTSITATVAQYGDYIVQSDVLELTSLDNTILEATKLLGRQAGLTLDTITRNVLVGGTNVLYAPKYVTTTDSTTHITTTTETPVTSRAGLDKTAVLTVDLVEQAVTQLRAQNAPTIGGSYVCVLHPYAAYDLMRDPDWRRPHEYSDTKNLYEGELGMIGGVRFVSSTEAKIWTGTGCPSGLAVFACLFIAEGAYGVTEIEGGGLQTIVKQKGSAGTADPLDQRSSVGWKALKTAEILVQSYLLRVECCSSRYSATAAAN